MGGKRIVAAFGVLVGAGLLTGCCLFSGDPTVTLMPSTASAKVGETVTFMAQATGGGGQYTYVWMGAMGQGQMATATFQSPGTQMVSVTVTDNCGKSATAMTYVTVGGSVGPELTGTWQGEIVEFTGRVFELRLSLYHAGQTLQGTAYHAGRASTGSGTLIGTQIMFQFPFWFNTAVNAVLTGTVTGNEMSGTWRIGTTIQHTWRLTKI